MNHLNALQKPRNMKTRRLAQAEDDPELNKTVKLAALLKEIWSSVINVKGMCQLHKLKKFCNINRKSERLFF